MRTYSLYLSTTTPSTNKYAPTTKTNLANVSWNINWKEIFGDYKGEVNCRVKLISTTGTTTAITWAGNTGSLRASLSSPYQNVSNGVNLGFIRPQYDTTATSQVYLDVDTITGNGITIITPTSNQILSIQMIKADESLMTNAQEYQLWLYFDLLDKTDYTATAPLKGALTGYSK